MAVFKRFRGKRIGPRDKDYAKGTWYVWKRIEGRIIHRSIPLAQTKEEAEHAEREIIREVFNKKYGRGSSETFGSFVERVYRPYFEQHNVNRAAKVLYVRLLSQRFSRVPLSDITPQDCRNVQTIFRKTYSASTVNLIMSTASKIFNLAGEEGILKDNPMRFVKRVKEPPPRDRLLSKEEWERLWFQLHKDGLLLRLVTLAINLPLRRGQLLAITPDAINLSRGLLFATASKGRADRAIPLNSTALTTLERMLADGEIPFPLKETGLRKRFKKICERAGISNFRFHDLRKEFASNLIRNNVNPEIVRQLFAHSSQAITQAYTHTQPEDLARAVRTLDDTQEVENVQ
jgi:integrase